MNQEPGAPNFAYHDQNYPTNGVGLGPAPVPPVVPTGAYSHTAGNSGNQKTINQWGLRDKYDQGGGLMQVNPLETQFNVLEHTIIVDTRDCIGERSLEDARTIFVAEGGRGPDQGTVTNAVAGTPITVTFNSVNDFRDGDTISIKGTSGITNLNGIHQISNINAGLLTADISASGTGTFSSSGVWTRPADHGYPELKDTDSTITDNVITVSLNKELKFIRTITLYHIVVPRDIIPLIIYLADFISASTDDGNTVFPGYTETNYVSRIPQEARYMETRMLGFYSTPLDLWRTYTFGAFSMQEQYTPPPLQLWNPPGPGAWPLQPIPYPYQNSSYLSFKQFSYNYT